MKQLMAIVTMAAFSTLAHSETVPVKQARQRGIEQCLPVVEKAANFLVEELDHTSLATWNGHEPDKRLFNAQVGVQYSDGNSVAVLNVAPTSSGKCDASYTTVFAMPDKSCAVLRETTFKAWKFHSESVGMIVLQNESGTLQKILLPSGPGCVAVTTEVFYQ